MSDRKLIVVYAIMFTTAFILGTAIGLFMVGCSSERFTVRYTDPREVAECVYQEASDNWVCGDFVYPANRK